MLIKTVTTHAEAALLHVLETRARGSVVKSFLQCAFSSIKITPPDADNLALLLKDILKDHQAVIYFLNDNDVIIEWVGAARGLKTAIEGEIAKYCMQKQFGWEPEGFFHYYDISAHGEDLRFICKHKIAKIQPEKFQLAPVLTTPPVALKLTPEQRAAFYRVVQSRAERDRPHILIIEDQAFSRTLLMSILAAKYPCYTAKDAAEALAEYAAHAPDILLLDIELPDGNGHAIARYIRDMDPDVAIVMVTANHYQSDVLAAKENKVQGFIVKPYTKQKILEVMENYKKT